MQSGTESFPPVGQPRPVSASHTASTILNFLRRRNRAIERDEAVTTWGIARRESAVPDHLTAEHFASELIVQSPEGKVQPLRAMLSTITLVFYVGEAMVHTPGLEHRLHRRAATLGPGVRLIWVTPGEAPSLPSAFIDVNGACARIGEGLAPPALLSLDNDGRIFDIQSDAEALLDWLWNDPHPRSRRASDR